MNERPDNVGDADKTPLTDDLIDSTQLTADQVDIDSADPRRRQRPPAPAVPVDSPACPAPQGRSWSPQHCTIGLLAVGGGTAASLAKHVTITVDGEQREVTTLAGSVEGALSTAGLQTGEHDVVAPAVDTQISDGSQIALERGRLLTLTINGQQRDVWTTADTVEEALVQLGQDPNALRPVRRPLAADPARRSGR